LFTVFCSWEWPS